MTDVRIERLLGLISEISKYCTHTGNKVGKKLLQKIIYLLQRKGLNLGYNFSIHYYGPYSSQLEYDVYRLEIHGLVNVENNGYTHKITPAQNIVDNLKLAEVMEDKNRDLIKKLCSFSARDLELIATVDYIINQMRINKIDKENQKVVIEKVIKLKGNKYSEQQIMEAITFLKQQEFINGVDKIKKGKLQPLSK